MSESRLSNRGVWPGYRNVLDARNELLAADGVVLHPTKGYRKISLKRTRAAMLVQSIKTGQLPFSMRMIRKALALTDGAVV